MRTIYYIIICLGLVSFSCLNDKPDDFDNPESAWNPSFSFPVGYTSLGMNDDSGFDTLLLLTNPITGDPYWVEEIDIPLSFIMPFDLQEIDRFSEEIIRIMFRINTYNGFPSVATGQVYFLDIDSAVVDSIFVNGPLTMEAGTLVDNGETVDQTHNQSDVIFDQNKIDDLGNVRFILMEGALNNVALDNTLIDYYPNYSLDIQLGIQAELNMSLSP